MRAVARARLDVSVLAQLVLATTALALVPNPSLPRATEARSLLRGVAGADMRARVPVAPRTGKEIELQKGPVTIKNDCVRSFGDHEVAKHGIRIRSSRRQHFIPTRFLSNATPAPHLTQWFVTAVTHAGRCSAPGPAHARTGKPVGAVGRRAGFVKNSDAETSDSVDAYSSAMAQIGFAQSVGIALVDALFNVPPVRMALALVARIVLADNARRFGVDWRASASKWRHRRCFCALTLLSMVERDLSDFMCVRRAELSGLVQRLQTPQRYPTYYRRPFHAYESGNLCWEAAFEVEAASLALTLRYWPNEVCVCMYVYTHPSTHAPATHATRTGEARKAESSRSAGQDATRHSRSRQSVLAHSASTRSRAKHGARESGCDVYTTAA